MSRIPHYLPAVNEPHPSLPAWRKSWAADRAWGGGGRDDHRRTVGPLQQHVSLGVVGAMHDAQSNWEVTGAVPVCDLQAI
jgi:hypothetical protein